MMIGPDFGNRSNRSLTVAGSVHRLPDAIMLGWPSP